MSKLRYNYNKVQFTYRNKQLKEGGFESYKQFLESSFWKALRNKLRQKRFFNICCCCGSGENINLHHIKYKNFLEEASHRYIFPLCQNCHNEVHKKSREKNISFKVAMRRVRKSFGYKMENRVKYERTSQKREKIHKYIILGEGRSCPKCGKSMQKRGHREVPITKYFYSQWDYCKPCGHVQHYNEFRNRI